ncbi:MAG: hypothetical protein R3E50_07360 [Halioglobus sp.]
MRTPDTNGHWPDELPLLLDNYLRKVGMGSPDVRARWVAHVLAWLQAQDREYAEDDIVENAVECLREAINDRLALIAGLDRSRDDREIAAMRVVLRDPACTDLVDALFSDISADIDPAARAQLRATVAARRPRPVPPDAPLAVPVQSIELRSMNPVNWLPGRSR